MSKMIGKQYLNSRRLNGILNGSENHKKPIGKFKFVQPDGREIWYSLFAATHRDGQVRTDRWGQIEINVREQLPRVEAEPISNPDLGNQNYSESWEA